MPGASRSNYLPDKALEFRAIGSAAITSVFTSDPLSLFKLAGFWQTGEWGFDEYLVVEAYPVAGSFSAGQTYDFELEVDELAAFGSPQSVGKTVVAALPGEPVAVTMTRASLERLDVDAKLIRLKVTPNGVKEAGSVVFAAVADAGDTVTIFDGVATTVFTFAASGNGATGAAVNVAVGASATDSATNLRNAINANLNINVTAGGATTTVSVVNDNLVGGSITKSDADNDYTVTNFSGGGTPSIQFYAFVKPCKRGSVY